MITDHKFRPAQGGQTHTGEYGGLAAGMCAWLGKCNQPSSAHAGAVNREPRYTDEFKQRVIAAYAEGGSAYQVGLRFGIPAGTVRYIVTTSGGTMRPRRETRTRS